MTNWSKQDPETSRKAGERHEASGKAATHRDIILAFVRLFPNSTAAELGGVDDLGYHETARRLPEMKRRGLIRLTGTKICSVTGNKAQTYAVAGGGSVAAHLESVPPVASTGAIQVPGQLFGDVSPEGWMR